MKKSRIMLVIAFLFITLSFGTMTSALHAQAASLTNVMKAPKAKKGNWVISKKGYRYRYRSTGKYAKSAWLKINGEIYYFKSDGYLQTGWKTYRAKRYYFDKSGRLVNGWAKIGPKNNVKKYYFWKVSGDAAVGKVKIAGKYYYFNSKGEQQTGWKKIGKYLYCFNVHNGSMYVNTTVNGYQFDKQGHLITTAVDTKPSDVTTKPPAKSGKVDIFVGDSRTVGMGASTGTGSKCIAKIGQGYDWYVKTAEKALIKKLKKNPSATVVFNLGVNDVANYDKYIARYKKLMQQYPKAQFYFMSLNPVGAKYKKHSYFLSYTQMKSWINKFNAAIKKEFPDRYIDCYTYLTKNKFETVDGLHYTADTYKKIYKYILTQV